MGGATDPGVRLRPGARLSGQASRVTHDANDASERNPAFALEPATPILVFGMERSGTKWLCNILANAPDVACVAGDHFGGILETNMFRIIGQKFDLRSPDDYAAFVELWTRSDFFLHTGLDRHGFSELLRDRGWPTDPIDVFELVMTATANRAGRKFWLQKAGPDDGASLPQRFPQAKLLVIVRGRRDTVRSAMELARKRGAPLSHFQAVYGNVIETKMLRELRRRHPVCWVDYEALLEEPEAQIARVCEFIGIAYSPELLEVRFQKNSSFDEADERRAETPLQRAVESFYAALCYCIPLALARGRSRIAQGVKGARGSDAFIHDSFASAKDELGL